MIDTLLGPVRGRNCYKYSDQYGPRRTVRLGPLEDLMLAGIFRQEARKLGGEVNAQWVCQYGLALLLKGASPPYRTSKHDPDSTLPKTASIRLVTSQEDTLAGLCQAHWVKAAIIAEETRKHSTPEAIVLRSAIWAAWYDLGCPR